MSVILLDANAVIMHGRAFSDRVHAAFEAGNTLVLPQSVKQELVDDVIDNDDAPANHRASAQAIQELIDGGFLVLHSPSFETYGHLIDEARRRIADDSLPEHLVQADQYIPAIVCELAQESPIQVVTADRKLRRIIRDLAERQGVGDHVSLQDPLTVL
jgi:rRNA-processing protein FCF1